MKNKIKLNWVKYIAIVISIVLTFGLLMILNKNSLRLGTKFNQADRIKADLPYSNEFGSGGEGQEEEITGIASVSMSNFVCPSDVFAGDSKKNALEGRTVTCTVYLNKSSRTKTIYIEIPSDEVRVWDGELQAGDNTVDFTVTIEGLATYTKKGQVKVMRSKKS